MIFINVGAEGPAPSDPVAQRELEDCCAWIESDRVRRDAFLWFIGVLRDRLGELEDRFFATLFAMSRGGSKSGIRADPARTRSGLSSDCEPAGCNGRLANGFPARHA
jgi:hypothetical protein